MNQRDMTSDEKSCSAAAAALGETNDCAVRAVSLATGVDYNTVHALMKQNGRRSRCGTYMHTTEKTIRDLGFEFTPIKNFRPCTVRTVASQIGRGSYLVRVSRHILCVRDGTVLDWSEGRCKRVKEIFVITRNGSVLPQVAPTPAVVTPTRPSTPVKPRNAVSVRTWLERNAVHGEVNWFDAVDFVRLTGRSTITLKVQAAKAGLRFHTRNF